MSREGEALTLAQLELHDAELGELDAKGVLAFADRLLTTAGRRWPSLGLGQKLRLQSALFQSGVAFDGESFGTPELTIVCSAIYEPSRTSVKVWRPQGESHLCGGRRSKEKPRSQPDRLGIGTECR